MPYSSKKDLPKQVQGLPDHAKSIFMAAFNSAMKDTKDEERAFKIAWAAVKRKFKKEGDKWVAKDGFESEETIVMDATDEASVFRTTADGFLLAQPRVARTGIQISRGWEVGKPEMDEVKVYRSEAEVFDQKSLKTFAYRTLTLGHPSEMVSSDNWKDTAIGHTGGEIVRDGSTIRVPLLIMDKDAINRINDGVKELRSEERQGAFGRVLLGPELEVRYHSPRRNVRRCSRKYSSKPRRGCPSGAGWEIIASGGRRQRRKANVTYYD
jgi:cation transport regulator ChaB